MPDRDLLCGVELLQLQLRPVPVAVVAHLPAVLAIVLNSLLLHLQAPPPEARPCAEALSIAWKRLKLIVQFFQLKKS